jgi:carnitine 3-dehydrogenase
MTADAAFRGSVHRVLVVGAGAIGASWAAHLLLHGRQVALVDPVEASRRTARDRVLGLVAELDAGSVPGAGARLEVSGGLDPAADTDLVIECGPERLDLKRELMAELDRRAAPDVLITSSSSGLTPSSFQDACARPERVLIAHPFNPPHLIPLLEIVGGAATASAALDVAAEVFTGLGKRVIRVHGELPGHVVNRLQAALWREAYHLVEQQVVSVADLDAAIAWGPGLRWALLGPFATQHLSGGEGGIAHVLDHLGPPMEAWWAELGSPTLNPELVDTVVQGVADELHDVDQEQLRRRRDQALRRLLLLKADTGLT